MLSLRLEKQKGLFSLLECGFQFGVMQEAGVGALRHWDAL